MPNVFDIATIGQGAATQAASGLLGGLFGLMTEKHNDERQIRQQQALTDMQAKANRDQAKYTNDLQYEQWLRTSYPAQIEQMTKAGINPALLYGMSGGGGQTTGSASAQGVSSGYAPQGGGEIMGMMQMGLQSQLIQSQVELNRANAAKANADAGYTGGAGTNLANQQIETLKQNAKTEEAKQFLTEAQTIMQDLDNQIKTATREDQINGIINGYLKLDQERQELVKKNAMTDETWNDVVKIYRAKSIEGFLQNALTKATTITEGKKQAQLSAETLAIPQRLSNEFYQISGEQELKQITQKIETDEQIQRQLNEIGVSREDFLKLLEGLGLYYGLKGGKIKKGFKE